MWKSKNDFNILALRMGCRNKHWSQHFILIIIDWFICPRLSPWGTTCTGLQRESKLINKIKIWLNRCDMCLFLQPMLSARIPKSIFDFGFEFLILHATSMGLTTIGTTSLPFSLNKSFVVVQWVLKKHCFEKYSFSFH